MLIFAPQEVTYEEIAKNLKEGVNRRNQNLLNFFIWVFSIEGGANGFRLHREPLGKLRLSKFGKMLF